MSNTTDQAVARLAVIESLLTPAVIDFVRCGIGANYSGKFLEEQLSKHHEPLVAAVKANPEALLSKLKADATSEFQTKCAALYDEAFELLKNQCNVASDGMILMPAQRYSALINVLNKFRDLAEEK